MYLRMPQGYLASGDAYTRRYDKIIKDTLRKLKIVDDTLLYDSSIERAFYHTFDFLLQCARNKVVLNTDKFQFCQDVVEFGGLQITWFGVTPSESIIQTILDFPVPKTITNARSWFGLVNQVALAYSLGPVMLSFQDLVKQNSKFAWNQSLEDAFKDSKRVIIDLVQKGVAMFDKDWVICLNAVFCQPVAMVHTFLNVFPAKPFQSDIQESNNISDIIKSTALMAIFASSYNIVMISQDLIHAAGHGDPQYEKLISVIQQGFPRTCNLTAPEVHEYWEVRHRVSTDHGRVLLNWRIVTSKTQWRKVLHCLHSAHQGVIGMKACANESVY